MKRNILINDLDEKTIIALDQEAKEKRISRNELIRHLLKNHINIPELAEMENKYIEILDKCLLVIERNSNLIEKIIGGGEDV